MNYNWKSVTEQQKKVIEEIERKRFKQRTWLVLIGCIIFYICTSMFIGMNHHSEKESIEYEILGYYPDSPPQYQALSYPIYETENYDDSDIAVYDPDNETWEEYMVRFSRSMPKTKAYDWDEFTEKQEKEEKEFYREQEKEMEQARAEAGKQANRKYAPYYILAMLRWLVLGAFVLLVYYQRWKDFCTDEMQICTGKCIEKEKTVYKGKSYRRTCYFINIQLESGEIVEHIRVQDDIYDDVKFGTDVVMVKTEWGEGGIDRVYPQKVFWG